MDFVRMEPGKHIVERIEYDPNRSAHLALIESVETKKKSYIIAAEGMRAGDAVESFLSGIPDELLKSMGGVMDPGMLAAKTAFRGNCLPMKMVPLGTQVYCVGSTPKKRAVFCRSAGTYATVISKEETSKRVIDVTVRLQSGEVRKVAADACATIGVASNPHHHFRQLGKAGRSRWLNIRPTVRGVAMNAVDHPHGGGRGKSKGNVHPVSIWGTPVSFKHPSYTLFRLLTHRAGQGRLQDEEEEESKQVRGPGETSKPRQAAVEELDVPWQTKPFCCCVCICIYIDLNGSQMLHHSKSTFTIYHRWTGVVNALVKPSPHDTSALTYQSFNVTPSMLLPFSYFQQTPSPQPCRSTTSTQYPAPSATSAMPIRKKPPPPFLSTPTPRKSTRNAT